MANTSIMLPTLHGGVSTQAPALRFPNQFTSATNALFTVKDGLALRPGTKMEFAIPAYNADGVTEPVFGGMPLVADTSYRVHTIKRDSTEKYIVVYGPNVLRIFDTSGNEAAVNSSVVVGTHQFSTDVETYLQSGTPTADDLRLVTVADYTLVLNTKVVATTSNAPSYAITKTHRDFDVMISHTPADGTYHKTSNSTESETKGYHLYDLTSGSFPTWHRNARAYDSDGSIVEYFKDAARNPGGFKVKMGCAGPWTAMTWSATANTLTKAAAFADYTWQSGDQIYISSGTGATPGFYTISSKTDDNEVVLASDPGISGQSDYAATQIVHEYEVTVNMLNATMNDGYDVAQQFQDALVAAGCNDGLIEWYETGVNTGYFVITGAWRGAGMSVEAPTSPSSGYDYTDDAAKAFNDNSATAVAGTGTIADADKAVAVLDRWTKVSPPGDPDAVITASTMPLKLVRTSTSPLTFTLETIDWIDRLSGDHDTNPIPKIWENGYAISDLTFHRDRLWLAGGEYLVSSQAGDYFNFFIDDAENLADADPIEAALSTEKVTLVDYMVPFRKTLLILAKSGAQFELNAPERLTPDTAAITPTTSYNTLAVRPDTIGLKVYLASSAAPGTQLLEYFYNDSASAVDAADVSQHAAGYLPTTAKTLRACPNDDTVFLLPTAGTELYVYRTFFDGSKRQLSAWGKYTLTGATKICDIGMIDSRGYMLIDDGDGFFVNSIPAVHEATESGFAWGIRLDNKVSKTGSYNPGTGKTTWTLTVPDGSLTHAISPAGVAVALTKTDSTHYWATGDYDDAAYWLGGTYSMSVVFSKPFVRGREGEAKLDMKLQLIKLRLNHQNSGPYSLSVTSGSRAARSTTYTPATNPETDGTSQFFILGSADDTTLTLSATGPKPVSIASGEYAVTYNQWSR